MTEADTGDWLYPFVIAKSAMPLRAIDTPPPSAQTPPPLRIRFAESGWSPIAPGESERLILPLAAELPPPA